jgi:enamine deaminase RidA (YjgF/YER057c/UK114 family)
VAVERWGSGGPWEATVGYSRVVRAGELVLVSGCTAVGEDGDVVGEGNVYLQAQQAIANIARALEQAGASLTDVVRTRVYLLDATRWEEAGRAHGEAFADIRPANTMLEVAALIDPRLLVEIEAEAYAPRV